MHARQPTYWLYPVLLEGRSTRCSMTRFGNCRSAVDAYRRAERGQSRGVLSRRRGAGVPAVGRSGSGFRARRTFRATSNIAGGQFHPFGHFNDSDVTPEWRGPVRRARSITAGAVSRSWSATITGSAGCRPMRDRGEPGAAGDRDLPADQPRAAARPNIRSRSTACAATTRMYVETGRFLRQMIRDVQIAGGKIEVRRLRHAGRHRRFARERWCSTAPASARALCSATRSCARCAASSPCSQPQHEVRYAFTRRCRLHVPARRRHPARRHVRAATNGTRPRSRRPSRGSSARISASSPASAAPLEAAARASNLVVR